MPKYVPCVLTRLKFTLKTGNDVIGYVNHSLVGADFYLLLFCVAKLVQILLQKFLLYLILLPSVSPRTCTLL